MNAPTSVPALVEARPVGEVKPPLVAGARPRPIVPTDMDQVWRFAQIVAKSGIAPKDMQKPETISIAIMHGLEVGLTPLMALQRIAVINGRPSIWGDAAIGLVRASGLCEFVQEIITGDGENMVAVCRAKRKTEKDAIERTFSVADAKKAGLWGKAGPWQQYPKRMLQMRVRAFALRDLFADVLGGLYIAEELEGMEDDRPAKDVTPRPVIKGRASPELPPAIPQRAEAEAEIAEASDAGEPSPPVVPNKRPLPPPAKARGKPADADGIPAYLQRACPPADQPEAFRAWIVAKLTDAKSDEDVQLLWDSHVAPNVDADQIIPSDLEDITGIFASRKSELERQ